MQPITVLVRTHGSDDAEGLSRSIESLLDQTAPPETVLVLEDGSVSGDLSAATRSFEREAAAVSVRRWEATVTRGEALRRGVAAAETPLVAVLDCGDAAVRERFEVQRAVLDRQPEVAVVGGYVSEFESDPDDPVGVRTVPTEPAAIRSFAKSRSPVNQPTACFRRAAVLEVGNYRPRQRLEDYELWVRLLASGERIANVDRVLTHVEVDHGFYARRGGLGYLREEVALHRQFYRMGFVSAGRFARTVATRVPVRLLPRSCRAAVYRHALRK